MLISTRAHKCACLFSATLAIFKDVMAIGHAQKSKPPLAQQKRTQKLLGKQNMQFLDWQHLSTASLYAEKTHAMKEKCQVRDQYLHQYNKAKRS